MKNNKIGILIVSLVCIISTIIISASNNTMAYEYNTKIPVLFYNTDNEKLSEDIKKYINEIDDIIMPITSFDLSNILNENYDFLTYFAMEYILENYDYFKDNIIIKEEHNYKDNMYNNKVTDKYIDIETIYEITDNFFGVRDYMIINKDVSVIDNYISLIDYSSSPFDMQIKNVTIKEEKDIIQATIDYKYNKYLYTLKNKDNKLKIINIEVIK